jgi:hypothetical protein
MPALAVRLLMCAALVAALGAAKKTDWYRVQNAAQVASGPKLPIKSSFSGYIIAVG